MAGRFFGFATVTLALACATAGALSSTARAQSMPSMPVFYERVSAVTVTPATADAGAARAITISGSWFGCAPVGATLPDAAASRPSALVVRLVFPLTLAPCAAALFPYTVSATYVPGTRGIARLLVLNVDGEYLGEGLMDTRAADDSRSAFNLTGMWYDPQTNGSGLTFVHSRVSDNAVFGTWYLYDATGKSRWYTIQDAVWKSPGRVMEGVLYETSAVASCPPPVTACPARLGQLTTVGRARVTLTGAASARVDALTAEGAVIFSSNVIRPDL